MTSGSNDGEVSYWAREVEGKEGSNLPLSCLVGNVVSVAAT